jgi:hypothetical protein
MLVSLLTFVVIVKRVLSVAVTVVKFSNGIIIHIVIMCLSSSIVSGKISAMLLASID